MRASRHTVTCDRCGKEEQLENFSKAEMRKLAASGWWSYTSTRFGVYFDYHRVKDFCRSCSGTVGMIARDADRNWVEYKDPHKLSQYELHAEISELSELMDDEWLLSLRNELTNELRKRRPFKKKKGDA